RDNRSLLFFTAAFIGFELGVVCPEEGCIALIKQRLRGEAKFARHGEAQLGLRRRQVCGVVTPPLWPSGVNGFIAEACVLQFLSKGFSVRRHHGSRASMSPPILLA